MREPQLIIIAGPNGSGKSTIFPAIQNVNKDGFFLAPINIKDDNFINSDNNNKSKIVYNARETIINNHLLSHQVDQFKSLYNNIV